jgi:hypothetical protein
MFAGTPLVLWAIANHQRIRSARPAPEAAPVFGDLALRLWVTAVTIVAAGLLVAGFLGGHWSQKVRASEVWEIIAAHPGAELRIDVSETGSRWVEIAAVGPEKTARFRFQTRVQGRDYDVLGWPQRKLGFVTLLVLGTGVTFLVRSSRRARADSRVVG